MLENNFVIQEEVEKELKNRWGWLTEDIADEDSRLNTQIVLESSYKEMVKQGALPRGWLEEQLDADGVLTEAPQLSGAVGDYVIPKVMFPMIKRVMPDLIANKLVSVQPLSAPTGVIYYIVNSYSNTKGNVKAGDEFSGNPMQTTPAYSVFYSSEKIGPFVKEAVAGNVTFTKDDLKQVYDFLENGDELKRFEVFDKVAGRAVNAEDAFKAYGSVADKTKGITIDASKFAKNKDGKVVVQLFVVYNQEGTSRIPEMEFGIEHQNINTNERKLKVRWTKEAEQDMMAYHKINVEQELVKVAYIQMNYEIDREVMNFIDDHIIPELRFEHNWINDSAATGNNTQGNYLDRHRCLAQHMYQVATKIAEFNHIAPADWMVCSPQVAAVLQMLPDWKAGEISGAKTTFYNAGFLSNGTMAVYVDPNRVGAQAYEITLGYKSKDSTYGAGVVYSPYANWMSSTIINPENFNNVRGTFTRYGLTLCPRGEYNYATIRIDNLAI